MTVASMTGFARAEGHELGIGWVWELKSVNAKSLDLRFRLPAGYEGLEVQLRAGLAETLKRGAVSASLVLTRHDAASPLRVNRAALDALMALVKQLSSEIDVAPPRLDGLLAVKGVLESGDVEDDATRERRQAALLKSFAAALKDLAAMRLAEGKRLAQTLEARLAEITDLVVKAEKSAAAQPAAVKARLKKLLAQLLEAVPALPEERLAQEAALIVARDDVREELDRLDGACGGVARADKGGRRHRPAARFPVPGIEPRSQYLGRQIGRSRTDAHRARAQGRDRAVARAGPERRIGVGMATKAIKRRGILLVLSSPSGAGKTTITRALVRRDRGLKLSISATTRPRRKGEIDGKHYHFVDQRRFDAMVQNGELLEHAVVFGHSYGTPRAPVMAAIASGTDMVCDVDWQGAQQMKARACANDLVSIFILPPSMADLEKRLKTRAQDSRDVVRARMEKSADEMSHWDGYDYVVINRALDDSIGSVRGHSRRRAGSGAQRQIGLDEFVNRLRGGN